MWDATRHMAEAIGRGLAAEGVPYRYFMRVFQTGMI
jgi:flavorubredoxin